MAPEKPGVVRTAVVPVFFTRRNFRTLHDAAHQNALLWNELVNWVHGEWAAGRSPERREIQRKSSAIAGYALHAHTRQAVGLDLWDAISTARANRRQGLAVKMPWREKKYRPLAFTRNYGYRVTGEGMLALSLGRGRERVIVPLPTVVDARTGASVPVSMWGEITLCWDRDARVWAFHIPYRTEAWTALPVAQPSADGTFPADTVTVAVDEGIIHPFTLTVRDSGANRVDALVVSGREIRAVKRYRNKRVGSLTAALSRTKPGSRRHRKLMARKKQVLAKTKRRLRNMDHHVAAHADNWIRDLAVDKATGEVRPVRLVVGDVRGIEKDTNRKRRASRSTRQQLSQWSRGTHERHLSEKTGLPIEYVPEPHTSQTCPQCGTRRKHRGRAYECKNPACGLVLHRDVVGSGNIGSRADHGGTIVPWIDENTTVLVTYQRTVHVWDPSQRARHSRNQNLLNRAGPGVRCGGKSSVEPSNRATPKREAGVTERTEWNVTRPTARDGEPHVGSLIRQSA